jgi:hypothetical protein
VTYGHKGKGFEVQLTETCDENNPFEVVTAISVDFAYAGKRPKVARRRVPHRARNG